MGDFEASEVPGLSRRVRSVFIKNQDVLHYCGEGECDEDYRGLQSGRQYRENREYSHPELQVKIYYRFLTRVWTEDIERYISDFHLLTGNRIDILIASSCLWDVNRWGPSSEDCYRENIEKLISNLPLNCSFFWITSPPVSSELSSRGMASPGLDFQNFTTMFNVIEGNQTSATVLNSKKQENKNVNLIDFHISMLSQSARRNSDGIHWSTQTNRLMTNKILTHISLSLHGPSSLQGRLKSVSLTKLLLSARREENCNLDNKLLSRLMETAEKLIIPPGCDSQFTKHVTKQIEQFKSETSYRSNAGEIISKLSRRVGRFHPYMRDRFDRNVNSAEYNDFSDNSFSVFNGGFGYSNSQFYPTSDQAKPLYNNNLEPRFVNGSQELPSVSNPLFVNGFQPYNSWQSVRGSVRHPHPHGLAPYHRHYHENNPWLQYPRRGRGFYP